jgi:hypothetical protein
MDTRKGGGAWSSARNGGGRGGASVFSARGGERGKVERKGVVDMGVARVSPAAMAARDSPDSDQGEDKA